MPQLNSTRIEPAVEGGKRRPIVGPRDILITLGIGLLIIGVVLLVSLRRGEAEGSFVNINPFSGVLPSGQAPVVGSPAPDFELPLLDGGTFRLSEHRGHVVWINFWATWCPPCRAEMPEIQKVWQDEKGSDLALVAVDFAEGRNTVQAFVERLGLTFPIAMDSVGRTTSDYRVAGFPSHFLVDRNGILREVRVGLMSEATMRDKLERLRGY